MRFLKSANFELDEVALKALATEIEAFLRVGTFTASEWETLTPVEQGVAQHVKKALRLEDAILLREAFRASTVDEVAAVLEVAGDTQGASRVRLQAAVDQLGSVIAKGPIR